MHRSIMNCILQVAPLTGAWIETPAQGASVPSLSVAPLTGAWIETSDIRRWPSIVTVAPLTGAWIETSESCGSKIT